MFKYFVNVLLVMLLFSVELNAEEQQSACDTALLEYQNKFGGLVLNGKYTKNDALEYLVSNEQACQVNAKYYFIRSNVLYNLARYDESLDLLDFAIKQKVAPLGTVMYQKANIMRRLTQFGIKNFDYGAIKDLLIEAENAEHTNGVFIYLDLVEVLVLMGELNDAMLVLNSAVVLDPSIFRFFSLASIIETKNKNFNAAANYMTEAIKKGGQTSLNQPDSVLAFATILCHYKRNDEGRIIVNNARNLIKERDELPDLIAAKKIVDECKE